MKPLQVIGVVGAGVMGREIALVFALAGYTVLLADRTTEVLDAAEERLKAIVDKGLARGLYSQCDLSALERIASTTSMDDFAKCALVIEAVAEDESIKAGVLASLDAVCEPGCIIATNTSTIPISALASHLPQERRKAVVGMHYFSPVSRMKLVEVIPGLETAPETIEAVNQFCLSIGKTPIAVRDVPGFAVNRLLHAFLIESVRLVEEGVATPEDIDAACRLGLGHPMGPFELMDATTSSLCLQVQEILHESYGERFRPQQTLKLRVRAGMVGGRGKPGWRSRAPGSAGS